LARESSGEAAGCRFYFDGILARRCPVASFLMTALTTARNDRCGPLSSQ